MDAQTIAIVGLCTTAAVGFFAVFGPMRTARHDREHRVELARVEARGSRRERAYPDFAAYLERVRLLLERTEPMRGPVDDPPERLPDDEWVVVNGRLRVTASLEVQEAINKAHRAANEFIERLREYKRFEPNAGIQMHKARIGALAAIDTPLDLMNYELDNL
jgi:hypothetical protein